MAQTMFCNGCETQPAALLIQIIGTPDVLAFCPRCSLTWAEGHVAVMRDALGIQLADEVSEAGSGDLEAGEDGLPISGIPFKEDPRGIPIGIADTPDGLPAPDPAADGPGLPAGDDLVTEAPEGGVTDGQLRAHDPGPDAGDRPAADRAGPDDGGKDRASRQGKGGGGRGSERERQRSARSGVEPQAGP